MKHYLYSRKGQHNKSVVNIVRKVYYVVLGYSSKLKNVNVDSINYCITLMSYLICEYYF